MTKNTNLSRLNEVNFSNFNLRDAYITQNVEYLSSLRDESLFSNYGLRVLIRIPLTDDFDFFNAQVSYLIVRYGWSNGIYQIIDQRIYSADAMQRSKGNFKSLDIEVD